jgi:hypothetical protein
VRQANTFLCLARQRRPALDELLLALAAHFRPVDRQHALERLDEYSRHLFGLGGLHADAQAGCVLHALRHDIGMRPADCGDPDHLMLDRVLDRRRGHPLLLTAITAELARRAGASAGICSSPEHWFAAFGADELVLVELSGAAPGPAPAVVQRHCAHDVAARVLSRLCHAYDTRAQRRNAHRAAQLLHALGSCSEPRSPS